MIYKTIKEVKILTVEFNNGKPQWIKISIDQNYPHGSSRLFSMESKEFTLFDGSGATLKEIELLKKAYERVQALNFENFTFGDNDE